MRPFRVDASTFDALEQKFRATGIIYTPLPATNGDEGQSAKLSLDGRIYSMGIHTIDRKAGIVEGGVWLLDDSTMDATDELSGKLLAVLGEPPAGLSHGAAKALPFGRFIAASRLAWRIGKIIIWILALIGLASIVSRIIG